MTKKISVDNTQRFFFASSVLRKLVLLTHQSLYVKTWPRKPMKGSICFPIHSQSFEIKHFSHVTSNWIHSCEDTFIHDVVDVISPLFLISCKIAPNYLKDCSYFLHFLISDIEKDKEFERKFEWKVQTFLKVTYVFYDIQGISIEDIDKIG